MTTGTPTTSWSRLMSGAANVGGDNDGDRAGRCRDKRRIDPSAVAGHDDDRSNPAVDAAGAERELGESCTVAADGRVDVGHRAAPINSAAASASVIA
jgi:hypothetical protein